jgi:NADH dehydrogenase
MNIPPSELKRIVIIGGGFAGINFIKTLQENIYQVVMLDKHNYHTFQPLLYQVATGGLEAGSIAYPLRKLMQNKPNFFFRMANVIEVQAAEQTVVTDIGHLTYDYLIIATGSKTNFFGNKDIERYAISMKSIPNALSIRSLIIENFEQALLTNDISEQKSLMNFVLVGAGPTGVEMAGALAEMKNAILPKDYPDLDISLMQINLVQSGDKVLNTMSEKSSVASEKFLINLGVNVMKNTRVLNYDGRFIQTNTGLEIDSQTVIWTAGVEAAPIMGLHVNAYQPKSNRLLVNTFCQVQGHENIFALGDVAAFMDKHFENGLPMVAQPAIQQGQYLAHYFKNLFQNKTAKPFVYNDKGSMATIGRNKAVVDLNKKHFNGVFAWFLWLFVHLMAIVGFKNKAEILINWIHNYIKFDRESRLIITPYKKRKFISFTSDEI